MKQWSIKDKKKLDCVAAKRRSSQRREKLDRLS